MEKDTTPRYAPARVIVASVGKGAWDCPVRQYIAHPPGSPVRPAWIDPKLVGQENGGVIDWPQGISR